MNNVHNTKSMKKPKNPKRRAFCEFYHEEPNATHAAIRAGYAEKSATQAGSRLLTYADVKEYLADLEAARAERLQINGDRIVKRVAEIALAEVGAELNGEKLRIRDQLTALKMLGPDYGVLVEKREVSGPDGGPIELPTIELAKLLGFAMALAAEREQVGQAAPNRLELTAEEVTEAKPDRARTGQIQSNSPEIVQESVGNTGSEP